MSKLPREMLSNNVKMLKQFIGERFLWRIGLVIERRHIVDVFGSLPFLIGKIVETFRVQVLTQEFNCRLSIQLINLLNNLNSHHFNYKIV